MRLNTFSELSWRARFTVRVFLRIFRVPTVITTNSANKYLYIYMSPPSGVISAPQTTITFYRIRRFAALGVGELFPVSTAVIRSFPNFVRLFALVYPPVDTLRLRTRDGLGKAKWRTTYVRDCETRPFTFGSGRRYSAPIVRNKKTTASVLGVPSETSNPYEYVSYAQPRCIVLSFSFISTIQYSSADPKK